MGCTNACSEGHTYQMGCTFQTGTVFPTPISTPPSAGTVQIVEKCFNMNCVNEPSQGRFVVFTLMPPTGRHRPVSLLLCFPCMDAIRAVMPA